MRTSLTNNVIQEIDDGSTSLGRDDDLHRAKVYGDRQRIYDLTQISVRKLNFSDVCLLHQQVCEPSSTSNGNSWDVHRTSQEVMDIPHNFLENLCQIEDFPRWSRGVNQVQ